MTDEYPGRRLRCDGCRKRLTPDEAYEHYRECGSTVAYPYRPDRKDTERTELEDYV